MNDSLPPSVWILVETIDRERQFAQWRVHGGGTEYVRKDRADILADSIRGLLAIDSMNADKSETVRECANDIGPGITETAAAVLAEYDK